MTKVIMTNRRDYLKTMGLAGIRFGVVVAFGLTASLLVHSQGAPPSMDGKTAAQVYKNIKVLNATPADQVIPAMHVIRAALGVDCEFCHELTDRAADSKKPKETARMMMQMVMDLNKNQFNGKPMVACYTCHRGSPEPDTVPPLPLAEAEEAPQTALPSVDQILAKYVQALGGEQAIRKVTSRVINGTQFIPTGPGGGVPMPATVERDLKAPNLSVNIYHAPTYTISDGFDGTTAWAQDQNGRVASAVQVDQTRAKRSGDFYEPLSLKSEYTQMEVHGTEIVNGRDAYVVIAHPSSDTAERLYFDTHTGLLLRKWTALTTPAGDSPFEVNYADYRDTGSGVKFPYLITSYPAGARLELGTTAVIRVTKVQDNAAIDDSKFAKPAPKAAAAQ